MRASLVCVLALACAHPSSTDAPAAGAAAASSMPSTREPASTAAPDSAPAAQHPSAPGPASGGVMAGGAEETADDTAPCNTDADCVLTRHPPGSCCPSLCAPRAATKQAAERLEQSNAACKCAMPMCRPPTHESAAACVQNRCVVRDAGPTY